MKIKVCGLREAGNIEAVAALKPDFMGFIWYAQSPRYVYRLPETVLRSLPANIIKTAVFVNEHIDIVRALIHQFDFNAVQLHGQESPEYCAELKQEVQVLKAFGLDEYFDFEQLKAYVGKVDYFLFDTKTEKHGGSGRIFNWDVLNEYDLDVPFFLSGGLSLDNLAEIKNIKHPALYGVDLNSRFETAPGIKSIEKLKQAFALLKSQ
ncbi:phosphoribosylanthranilate isomerase [Mucilaginibacter boryungensis]|uniref:N-(5'-phosphoribosyl)anthranilate isomerase n=1 Tax=Mucilaginibacter boryungensis TaxID=768480 RepID=A0ABR9XFF9_9SPHI|nr:phosphoribosylanthranilate isomerase [Mucilaginibacter boryungensis]MBE9665925.1 phosphoribosylanthranilate isomerase [Mucilaginibacter boryungensis]